MRRELKTQVNDMIKNSNLEELAEVYKLLGDNITDRVMALNKLVGINVLDPSQVTTVLSQATTTEDKNVQIGANVKTDIKDINIKTNTHDKFIENCEDEKYPGNKFWDTKDMPTISEYDKKAKVWSILSTDEEGLLYTTVSKQNPALIGGQYAKDKRVYNFVYNPAYEFPVFFGPCDQDFLEDLKVVILDNLPTGYKAARKRIPTEKKSDYGFPGRFYRDEMTEDKFIFKTKNGYEGYSNGVAFKVIAKFNYEEKREVLESINIINYNYYFSHNYENAKASRMKHLYPHMIKEIEELIEKVNHKHETYVHGKDNDTIKSADNGTISFMDMPTTKSSNINTKDTQPTIVVGRPKDSVIVDTLSNEDEIRGMLE